MANPLDGASTNKDIPGVNGSNDTGIGTQGVSKTGTGVIGTSDSGVAVWGHSNSSTGVGGVSETANGIQGISVKGPAGVRGDCAAGVGVQGNSTSGRGIEGNCPQGTGVVGASSSGVGIWGGSDSSTGAGGMSKSGFGVQGVSQTNTGVLGNSTGGFGVQGVSETNTGVAGNSTSGYGVVAQSKSGIALQATGGQLAARFEGDVEITGDIRLLNVADCAEEFDILESSAERSEPGTVMVLGEDGGLRQSQRAYDKCAAGVVSGAGSYKPGIVLDKQQSQTKRQAIALLGKAFCKVDAGYAPIETGDLLTTSDTPGHAMKADDPLRAFGTVIGKALRPQKEGRGLIPILIALQ
jgi:hypothetical protein